MEKKVKMIRCKICNKDYSSKCSLCNHTRKYHKNDVSINIPNDPKSIPNVSIINNKICKYCKKSFSTPQNRWKHENKVCKEKNNIKENKCEIEELKEKNKQLEKMIIELSNKIEEKNITNNNTINNNTQNIQNNITINKFGNESIYILEENDVKKIINDDKKSIVNLVEVINFNEKYPENHNFCNTSLEGKYFSVLNPETKKIEKIHKNKFYDKLLQNSHDKIYELYDRVKTSKEFKKKYKKKTKDIIEYMVNTFIPSKYQKKNYNINMNEISYNKKNMILDTWKTLKLDEEFDNYSDSDDSYVDSSDYEIESKYNTDDD
jgi:hypothetical protein